MNSHIPRAEKAQESHWYDIAISIISQILTARYDAKYYFGMAEESPLAETGYLVAKLRRLYYLLSSIGVRANELNSGRPCGDEVMAGSHKEAA